MKIDDRNTVNVNPADIARAQAPEAVQPQTGAQEARRTEGVPGDRVALSDLSAKIRELVSGSPAREARIAELAAQFEAGRYEPDPGAVADAMIAEAEMGAGDEGF
ncbi:MAG: flagellar biosynthesis anti-sigma factor FlgM [Bryobacteraceae bacterium]|nr:flagellar biosynthesis anti-sigma factor FlgM [Bryobacteraceae bacterium]